MYANQTFLLNFLVRPMEEIHFNMFTDAHLRINMLTQLRARSIVQTVVRKENFINKFV